MSSPHVGLYFNICCSHFELQLLFISVSGLSHVSVTTAICPPTQCCNKINHWRGPIMTTSGHDGSQNSSVWCSLPVNDCPPHPHPTSWQLTDLKLHWQLFDGMIFEKPPSKPPEVWVNSTREIQSSVKWDRGGLKEKKRPNPPGGTHCTRNSPKGAELCENKELWKAFCQNLPPAEAFLK